MCSGYFFHITTFYWPDTLYLVLIYAPEEEEFLSPPNVSCSVILSLLVFHGFYLVFQLSCSIDKFVYFIFSILSSLFLVQSSFYYLPQCTFLMSMWFILLLLILSWRTLFLSLQLGPTVKDFYCNIHLHAIVVIYI